MWRRKLLAASIVLLSLVSLILVVAAYGYRHRIYRHVLLAEVASQVPDHRSTEERALRAFDEILRIAPMQPDATIDDDPASTLIRGWGYCDSAAMAFVQVAERAGLRGQMVFLTGKNGDAPHTVGTIWIDGAWRVFDPWNRSVSRLPNGDLATPVDIAAGRAPTTGIHVNSSWFGRTRVFYESQGATNLRSTVRKVAITIPTMVPEFLRTWIQELYLLTEPPTYVETNGKTWESWEGEDRIAYWKARNYDVFARFDRARDLYRQVIHEGGTRYDSEAEMFLHRMIHPPFLHRELTKPPAVVA